MQVIAYIFLVWNLFKFVQGEKIPLMMQKSSSQNLHVSNMIQLCSRMNNEVTNSSVLSSHRLPRSSVASGGIE